MVDVEYFRWWVTAPGRKRRYLTRHYMSAQEVAKAHYLTAEPDQSSRQVRRLPETAEELATALADYQSAGFDGAKPPAKPRRD